MAGPEDYKDAFAEAAIILDESHRLAIDHFGEDVVEQIPRLVTDIAAIVAGLSARTPDKGE